VEFSGELMFDGGMSAGFLLLVQDRIAAMGDVSGTLGSLRVPDFVIPRSGNESLF